MRRPRAFTCSRLRAEPLPPPARKPLGYAALNEDSWGTILRSSSPCKCGGCGVDSSSSSPKTTPSSQRTRLPDSTTSTSTRHGWEAITGTPPRPSDASPVLPPASRPDTPACESLSKFSPAARRLSLGETAPARRIVFASKPDRLDGDKTATTTTKTGNINHAAVGGSNSLSSERKRGSDGARSAPGNLRGMFSPPPGLSFGHNASAVAAAEVAAASASAATATAAAAAAASCVAAAPAAAATASTTSEKKCGAVSGPTCTMAPAEVRAYAAAAAFASLASPDYGDDDGDEEEEEEEDDDDDAGKGGGSRDEGWSFPVKQGFGAPVEGGSVAFGGAFGKPFTGVSAASSSNSAGRSGGGSGGGGGGGGGGSSNMKVDSLDEWKAPETGGIFSLGAPPQSNGFGRRRRMRVGG